MKKYPIIVFFLVLASVLLAQDVSNNVSSISNNKSQLKNQQKQEQQSSFSMSSIFYGGSLGLSFGDVTSIRINPMIGYRISPKLSAGLTGLYEYNSYRWNGVKQNYNNYGGSVFSRYRIIPQFYAHAEFSYISYERIVVGEDRTALPFLFLGGGYSQRIGPNIYAYAQILFDVLQDSNSPYTEWTPFYSFGVSVGF